MTDVKVGIIMGSQSDWPTIFWTSWVSATRRKSFQLTVPQIGFGPTAKPLRIADFTLSSLAQVARPIFLA